MINVSNLTVRIGPRTLLQGASFHVDKGMRIGLVGRNGAGKTTTMRMLAGEPDRGEAEFDGTVVRRGSLAYLPQDSRVADPQQKGLDRILSVRGIDQLLAKIEKAQIQMSTLEGPRQQKAMERYVRLDQEFTNQGGYAAKAHSSQIASSLCLN